MKESPGKKMKDSRVNNVSRSDITKSRRLNPGFFIGGILLLSILLYWNSLRGSILNWDDKVYIVFDTLIQKLSVQNIREIFSRFYASNYHPLTTLSWALEFSIGGIANPFIYHFDNLILHLFNTFLVFRLFRIVTKNDTAALIVALFHAIHPMHVESVAWISERKDLLYSLFFLLALIFYCQYITAAGNLKSKKYFAGALLFFILSLFAKSAAVIFPVVLVLFDFLYKRKVTLKVVLEKIPFFLFSLLFGILALQSQQDVIANLPMFSFFQRLLIINHSFMKYFWLSLFPVGLSAYHPWPSLTDNTLPFEYYITPLLSIVILAAVIFSMKKTRIVLFGVLFFAVNLLLVIQLIPVGVAVMAERYSYISYLGIFFIAGTAIAKLLDDKRHANNFRTAGMILLVLLTAGYSFATSRRVEVWQKDKSLWDDMINHYPSNAYVAYYNRAKYYYENNNKEAALADLNKLIEWKQYYSESITLRGSIYADAGNLKDAISDYTNAIAFDSTYFLSYNNRGSARMKINELSGALDDLNKAIIRKPDYYQSWYNRGVVKVGMKDFAGAMNDFNQCTMLNPSYCLNYYGMGNAFSSQKLYKGAVEHFTQAIECDRNFTDAYINRGNTKIEMHDLKGAIEDFSSVITLDPQYSYAWFNRGRVEVLLNNNQAAMNDISQSIKLNPSFGDAYVVLGNIKFNAGDKSGACSDWSKGAATGNQICMNNLQGFCR